MDERVKKFKSIFYGLDRAYGQYKSDGQSVNGKAGGQAYILKKPVTDRLWIDHIEGKDPSLGIKPIRDDSTCIWGCIDIDTYPLDHKKIIRKNIDGISKISSERLLDELKKNVMGVVIFKMSG